MTVSGIIIKQSRDFGEMTEWLKVTVLKTVVPETVPWVRIPLSPPDKKPTSAVGFLLSYD